MRILTKMLITGALLSAYAVVSEESKADEQLIQPQFIGGGFVVLAEQRFDPWVQRLMAERSLKAMPLNDGRLYYFYPMQSNPYLEEMQIRYLEELLEKQKNDEPLND